MTIETADNPLATTVEKPRTPALRILNELSRGTYVSYTRALKELLSNAWDALASEVQIKIADDFSEISILDNGTGMSEQDVRERFLRIGGSSAAIQSMKSGRRVIGHKGIGALSVIPICDQVRVLTTKKGSEERLEAVLDITRLSEVAKQEEDLETHYVYTLNKWQNERKSSNYTFISLRNLKPDMIEFLSRKGVTLTQYIGNIEELSGIEQLKWDLSIVSPIEYAKDGPFKERDIGPVERIKTELSSAKFNVFVNGEKLFKPVILPSADIKISRQYKRGLDYEIYPIEYSDDELEFRGYIFSQATAIMPAELRGGLVRVNNVAIGSYDLNWMKYQKSPGPRLVMTTGEMYVSRGLDQAILIDRDRFRETDKNYRKFREIIHEKMKEAFQGATGRSRKRSSLEEKQKEQTFRKKIEAKASQYLTNTYREKPIQLELGEFGNRPPLVIDKKMGKVSINKNHKMFRSLKEGEREVAEAFLLAIGIGKERSGGDINRMLEEIFKIADDLLEARRKR